METSGQLLSSNVASSHGFVLHSIEWKSLDTKVVARTMDCSTQTDSNVHCQEEHPYNPLNMEKLSSCLFGDFTHKF